MRISTHPVISTTQDLHVDTRVATSQLKREECVAGGTLER